MEKKSKIRRINYKNPIINSKENSLKKILYCGYCKNKLTRQLEKRITILSTYTYRCQKAYYFSKNLCYWKGRVKEEEIKLTIQNILLFFLILFEPIKGYKYIKKDINSYTQNNLSKERQSLLKLYAEGKIDDELYVKRKNEIEKSEKVTQQSNNFEFINVNEIEKELNITFITYIIEKVEIYNENKMNIKLNCFNFIQT